jgi:oxygen-dependent protoporphyrinogen oxidase
MRCAIIGAGLSGLATAFYLKRAAPDTELVVFEAEHCAGGKLQTVELDGFRFETAANGFLSSRPDGLQLVRDASLEAELLESSDSARKRFLYTDRLERLPDSPPLFVRSRLLSWPQKLRAAGEILVPPRRDGRDESLREFGDRRLGPAFTRVFLDAIAAGVHASTPDQLSVAAAFPLVAELERQHGGLIRGMIARRRREAGPRGVLMSLTGGIGMLVRRLAAVTQADWRYGDRVQAIERRASGLRIVGALSGADVDRVVVCTPSYVTAELVAALDGELTSRLAAIAYAPIAVVGLGFHAPTKPLDGFGLLTTSASRQPILGVTWDSSIFRGRAPDGAQSLRVMIGGQRDPDLVRQDDAGLIATARAGLSATMGLDRDPDVTFVTRWERGIPAYAPGHVATVDAIQALAALIPGLHLNCNAYRGIGINDCARESRELAQRLARMTGNGNH